MISGISSSGSFPTVNGNRVSSPEEAAKQFEEVLVKEFVRTMTKDVFKNSLAGDDTPSWVRAQGESQGESLADEVTKHLVEQGTLGIADMLLRQWKIQDAETDAVPGAALPLNDPGAKAPFALAPQAPLSMRSNPEQL